MLLAIVTAAFAALRRLGGDDRWMALIGLTHGRAFWWLAPFYGMIPALLGADVFVCLSWVAAHVILMLFPHGRWYDLGRAPVDFARDGPPTLTNDTLSFLIEAPVKLLFERGSWAFDATCLFLVKFAVVLGFAVVWYAGGMSYPVLWALALAAVSLIGYEIGWRVNPNWFALIGEIIHGGAWGVILYLVTK